MSLGTAAFIAARMGSERMPGKVLSNLAGIPSLVHIFNILRRCRLVDDFAVLTTGLKEDDIIEQVCSEYNVKVFRSSVHDVLERFRVASMFLKPQRIVRVTGDDPLMDPSIIDKVIEEHCKGNYDYTSNMIERTYPRGMDTEVIEYEALEKTWEATADKDDREHVTLFIRRNPGLFRMHNVKDGNNDNSDLRFCIDTKEDYEFVSRIFNELYRGEPIRMNEVIDLLKINPDLIKINSDVKQKTIKGKTY